MYLIQLIGIIIMMIIFIPYAIYTRLPPVSKKVSQTVTWWNIRIRARRFWNWVSKWQLAVFGVVAHYTGRHILSLPTPDITVQEFKLVYQTFNPQLVIEIVPILVARMVGIFLLVIGWLLVLSVISWVVTVQLMLRTTELGENKI